LKIGHHLSKLWAIKYRVVFMKHGVDPHEKCDPSRPAFHVTQGHRNRQRSFRNLRLPINVL